MARKFQDIIPPEKRSIRNIPIPEKSVPEKIEEPHYERKTFTRAPRKRVTLERTVGIDVEIVDIKPKKVIDFELENDSKPKSHKLLLTGIAAVAIVIIFFVASSVFSKAEIDIVPATFNVSLNNDVFKIGNSDIKYSDVSLSGQKTLDVTATGQNHVDSNATGTVIIFNNYSKFNQRLIAGTRLESSKGLIYKTVNSVTVPGQKSSGSNLIAGSVQVSVIAEKAGDNYNTSAVDFKIPGFKDTAKYDKFVGRSKDGMSGGFSGNVANVSSNDLSNATKSMSDQLKSEFINKINAQKPAGTILIPSSLDINYGQLSQSKISADGKTVTLSLKATATTKIFDKPSFLYALALKSGNTVSATSTAFLDGNDFSNLNYVDNKNGTISLTGNTTLAVSFDIKKLAYILASATKDEAGSIIQNQGQIESLKVSVTPWWKRSLPDDAGRISITIEPIK